jgi:membrane protein YqaA with SNARE-associated domain
MWGALFLLALVNAVIPLLGLGTDRAVIILAQDGAGLWVPILAALGQILGKLLLYGAGRVGGVFQRAVFTRSAVGRAALQRASGRLERIEAKLSFAQDWQRYLPGAVFVTAIFGIPSFGLMALLAGWARMKTVQFLLLGFSGRLVRYTAVYSWAIYTL